MSIKQEESSDQSEDMAELYSENSNKNIFKNQMDMLFPPEGSINFGLWEDHQNPDNIEDRVASQWNLYRKIYSLLGLPYKKSKVLEVAFGRGRGINFLNQSEIDIYGADLLDEHVDALLTQVPSLSGKIEKGEAESLNHANGKFDIVYSVEAAQHFSDARKFIEESYRVLKVGGRLLVATYFFNSVDAKERSKEYIPETIEGTHNAQLINDFLSFLSDSNFSNIQTLDIGNKVFPKYALWHQHVARKLPSSVIPKDKLKWKSYFQCMEEGSKHPWQTVYEKGWLSYLIVIAEK